MTLNSHLKTFLHGVYSRVYLAKLPLAWPATYLCTHPGLSRYKTNFTKLYRIKKIIRNAIVT